MSDITSALPATQMFRWTALPGWVHPDPVQDRAIREHLTRQADRHATDPSIARRYVRTLLAATHDRIRHPDPTPA